MNTHETKTRSVTKTIVWRIIATLVAWTSAYFFTGKLGAATEISLSAAVVSSLAYYLHERVWDQVGWGRVE